MPFKITPPLYSVWQSMKQRCYNPKARQYCDYGGRGIKVCSRWLDSYKAFVNDMGPRPTGTLLERIDNNSDYTPQNCMWATRKQQQRNQRQTRIVTIDGRQHIAASLSEASGMKTDTIVARASAGLTYDEVISPRRRGPGAEAIKRIVAARIAAGRAKTRCKHGHEFTPQNTHFTPQGWRTCKECARLKSARQRAAKRGH